jgi:hypothetical protein
VFKKKLRKKLDFTSSVIIFRRNMNEFHDEMFYIFAKAKTHPCDVVFLMYDILRRDCIKNKSCYIYCLLYFRPLIRRNTKVVIVQTLNVTPT